MKIPFWVKCFFCQHSEFKSFIACVRDVKWKGSRIVNVYWCSERNRNNRCKKFLFDKVKLFLLSLGLFGLSFLMYLFYLVFTSK
jgi:hypothetical protein